MNANRPHLWTYLLSFLIATILFIIIFSVAYSVSYSNYKSISENNNIINNSINRLNIYLAQEGCDYNLLRNSSELLDLVGSRLNLLETRFGKNDLRVLDQKKLYSQLQFEHFQIVENFNAKCDTNFTTIIFLYSNNAPADKSSENVGEILSTLKNKYPGKLMIYSFDYNLNADTINRIKINYNITSAPVIVVNNDHPIIINNIDQIEPLVA